MLTGGRRAAARGNGLLRGFGQRLGADDWNAAFGDDLAALFDIGAGEPHDQRHARSSISLHGLHDALRDPVAAIDAGEDVDEDALHIAVGEHEPEGGRDTIGRGAAADIEEVRRAAAGMLDHVHRRHGEAGAVDDAADLAFETDVVEIVLGRLRLARVLLLRIEHRRDIRAAEQRVVVERHLRIEREHAVVGGDDQRIDLEHRGVAIAEGAIGAEDRRHRAADLLDVEAELEGEFARLKSSAGRRPARRSPA